MAFVVAPASRPSGPIARTKCSPQTSVWGEHFVRAIGPDGLDAGATTNAIVLRSNLGYTGVQSRLQMLKNREFVDGTVQIFGKHGSRTWAKMGEFNIDRQLLTE